MGFPFWLLVLAQGFYTVNNVVLLAVAALAGLSLSPDPRWSTLPAAATVLGSALSTGLVARLQRAKGRRLGFQVGLGLGVVAFAICAWALHLQNFGLLVAGSFLAGFHGASGSLYRFAAAELVPMDKRERALSLVLVGGLVGAVFGPWLAEHSRGLFELPYVGAYAALSVVALLVLAFLSSIEFPDHGVAPLSQGRSVRELARQPLFVVAVLGGALGYGVMTLLMTATPIAMHQHHHSFHQGAQVLEWHILAMFAPGFFTGRLIERFGVKEVMVAGLALNAICVAVALSGVDLMQFGVSLILLGLGWNFLFTGASALLMRTYRPEEKNRAQAAMDFCTFSAMTVASLSSGILVTGPGWQTLLWVSFLPLGLLGTLLLWSKEKS